MAGSDQKAPGAHSLYEELTGLSCILSMLFIPVVNTMTKGNREGRGWGQVFHFTAYMKVHHERRPGQALKTGTWR